MTTIDKDIMLNNSPMKLSIMVLLQGLCYVVDITMVFLTFIGIFDFQLQVSRNGSRTGTMNFNHEVRSLPGTTATRF